MAADGPKEIKLLTFNIDTNLLRLEEGSARQAFPLWRANSRSPYIIQAINRIVEQKRPDFIHIQEGRKLVTKYGENVDSITDLNEYLNTKSYGTVICPYTESGGEKAFKFITAYDVKKYEIVDFYTRYLTRTPLRATDHPDTSEMSDIEKQANLTKIKQHNYGIEWERSVLIVGFKSHDNDDNELIYTINLHLDMATGIRIKSSKLILSFVEEILNKEPKAKIIIGGDFNAFVDDRGKEQLAIMTNAQYGTDDLFVDATQELKLSANKLADFSFIAFPYDFHYDPGTLDAMRPLMNDPDELREFFLNTFQEKGKALGDVIDRVFGHGFDSGISEIYPAPTCGETPESYTEAQVKQFIVNFSRKREMPAFASDHQPIVATFKCQR